MKYFKPLGPYCLLLFVAIGLSGLLYPSVNLVTADDRTSKPASTLDGVLQKGTLRVGVSLFTPWTLKKDGKLVGFEIDVANQLAKDLGVQLELKEFDWKEIIPALLAKKIDIISAGMVITPQRALTVNFSQPYANSGIGLATNTTLTKQFQSLGDLNHHDVTIGVVAGTVSEDLASECSPRPSFNVFKKVTKPFNPSFKAKVHGYVEHNPLPTFIALEHPTKVDTPLSQPLLTTKAGFAINKGNPDFINFLNAWIIAREADAWLPAAHDYWFKSLSWRQDSQKDK